MGEKSFPKPDKGLIARIYRELKKLNSQNINDPMKKWANELNGAFPKEEVQMIKKHMKKCPISLARECKSTPCYDSTSPLLEWLSSRTQTMQRN
jgi:hypothetical protein